MHIHEYQAKLILRQYGIPVSDFWVASSIPELLKILKETNLEEAVLKVQIHAGGRGKAGGVKVARNQKEIVTNFEQLLHMKIINNQTGPQGIVANQILITPLVDIKREFYIAAIIDRKQASPFLILSPEGGMEIEEIAIHSPQKILSIPILENGEVRNYNLLRIIKFMDWTGQLAEQGKKIVLALAKAFIETDASLIEINPLIETQQGSLNALDAKFSLDDNALYRQPQIASFYDPSQLTPAEAQANEFNLAYVALDGNIGCMVNGAGLAMATMDIIHLYKGSPANFLDVGGGATKEKVAAGFKIILSDPKVRSILVNIFGGIMNCETLALGIIEAAKSLHVRVPLIVRMEGTNEEVGNKLLAESGLNIIIAQTLDEAAQKAVNVANIKKE